jgi:hypothetical protein
MKPAPDFWKSLAEAWRTPLYYALLVFVVLIPIAYAVGLVAPGRKAFPFWGFVAVLHAVLCALVAVIGNAAISVTEAWLPRARVNRHASQIRNFDATLAVWPLLIAIIMLVVKLREPS